MIKNRGSTKGVLPRKQPRLQATDTAERLRRTTLERPPPGGLYGRLPTARPDDRHWGAAAPHAFRRQPPGRLPPLGRRLQAESGRVRGCSSLTFPQVGGGWETLLILSLDVRGCCAATTPGCRRGPLSSAGAQNLTKPGTSRRAGHDRHPPDGPQHPLPNGGGWVVAVRLPTPRRRLSTAAGRCPAAGLKSLSVQPEWRVVVGFPKLSIRAPMED